MVKKILRQAQDERKDEKILTKEYAQTLSNIKDEIRQAQIEAAISANEKLIKLYWTIGKTLDKKQKNSGWGTKVIESLAKDLQSAFPGMGGFSKSNIFRMRAFYRTYENCRTAARQLEKLPIFKIPWTHNIVIFEKSKSMEEMLWYAQKTLDNGLSRSSLENYFKTNKKKEKLRNKLTLREKFIMSKFKKFKNNLIKIFIFLCVVSQFNKSLGMKKLASACEKGNFTKVKELVEQEKLDLNKNCYSYLQQKPLHIAAEHGHLTICKYLIKQGARKRVTDRNGKTPQDLKCEYIFDLLKEGCAPYCTSRIEKLVEKEDLNVNEKMWDNGQTHLHITAKYGSLNIYKYLVAHGADENIQDDTGKTPVDLRREYLISAFTKKNGSTHNGITTRVSYLVEQEKLDVNERIVNGKTPLHLLAENRRLNDYKYLVSNGANPNIRDNNGNIPSDLRRQYILSLFKEKFNYYKLRHLESENFDFNEKIIDGKTLLHLAAENKDLETYKWLLEFNRSNPNIQDDQRRTPKDILNLSLISACKNGNLDYLKESAFYKSRTRVNFNCTSKNGKPLLHIAAESGNLDIYKLLLKHGANPAIKDANGFTALESAQEELECPACMDDKLKKDFMRLACGHIFCKECLKELLDFAIEKENPSKLECQDGGCEDIINYQDIVKIAENDDSKLSLLGDITTRRYMRAQQGVKYCPTDGCKHSFINDKKSRETHLCPRCQKFYCANCLDVPHEEHIPCRRAKEDRFTEQWILENGRRCPKCTTAIQKTRGCNHMTCIIKDKDGRVIGGCGHEFCYSCGNGWGEGCQRCQFYGGNWQEEDN